MKITNASILLFILAAVSVAFISVNRVESIEIGSKAPMTEYKMEGIDGKSVSLEDVASDNGLLVIFSCNTCPFVVGSSRGTEGWEGRYSGIKAEADNQKIGMVLVNSNEAKRDKGDSMKDMKDRAKEQGFSDIAYVLDKNHELADAFGAKTTPHVFLFNSKMELVYKGAIDDNVDSVDSVSSTWLKDALQNCSAGKPIDPNTTKAVGCSIKRVS